MRPLVFSVILAAAIGAGIPAGAETIRVGVTSGPHAQITEALVPVAKAKGLDVKLVEFSDGALIDVATHNGELDANAFQHTPYLDQQNRDRGLDIVSIGRTILLPMAGYSRKHKSLADLPIGAKISIPNDPTNGGRALKLLEAGGVIKLAPGSNFSATELDIVDNPKKVKILAMETAQLPRSLEDVDFSVITSFFALSAGLVPNRDSLLIESQQSDYVCLIGVARKDADKPWVKTLVESYQSPEVKQFIATKFNGNILAAW
ncbi:MetQ/NlpA family ABC transporter substrate-binding protein [Rhodopseudomonas sp. BR0G17]|uniref:MetQ/NlpA family ABC transporter substrate-binding protein n=1 Tax=Rhodopseudomonas sp. BR0G17 TaxID=2269368 RepID=UPI0019674FDA|nr:MetQ/NlpA family ABC transporter substrate-binding protein [Rhodopseudomonas sp. BR0G17]NEW97996.1 MetQ/NlpA family ABC transporter substrate-binding protein [Rhodopseudomonas sp. BR0G17]